MSPKIPEDGQCGALGVKVFIGSLDANEDFFYSGRLKACVIGIWKMWNIQCQTCLYDFFGNILSIIPKTFRKNSII